MSLEKQLADYGQLQEELFGAIEVDEITNPLTEGRQERTPSSQTLSPQRITRRTRHAGPAWAVTAFVSVLAVGAVYLLFSNLGEQVADNPPPTTVAPDIETMTDLQIIEAGVAALYSGDAERAVELFELQDGNEDQIRQEAAYQEAIGGRLTLNCTEESTPGVFTCNVPYHNSITDAVGYVDSPGDTNRVVVQEGVITEFPVPEHTFVLSELGNFLREQVEGDEGCVNDPRTPECANLIMDHLNEWADWCGQIVSDPDQIFANRCDTNGQPVTEVRQSHEFLDGEVTFGGSAFRYSFGGWDFTPTMETLILANMNERVALVADPLPVETGCEVAPGPAPVDSEALAQRIRTDPDLEVSESVAVSVGGIEGVRMDVVAAPGASNCDYEGWPAVLAASTGRMGGGHQLVEMPVGSRMRLYLLDLPEEISARILAIAIAAPESRFDHVMEAAAPIMNSLEFHTK